VKNGHQHPEAGDVIKKHVLSKSLKTYVFNVLSHKENNNELTDQPNSWLIVLPAEHYKKRLYGEE